MMLEMLNVQQSAPQRAGSNVYPKLSAIGYAHCSP